MIAELMTCDLYAFRDEWTKTDYEQIVCLIKYMHSLGIVHSDLHGSNLMCKATADYKRYRWYINDFGSCVCVYKPLWWNVQIKGGGGSTTRRLRWGGSICVATTFSGSGS